jgi:hypothetical protein
MSIILKGIPGPGAYLQTASAAEYPFKRDAWNRLVGYASATFLCRSLLCMHQHFLRGRQA